MSDQANMLPVVTSPQVLRGLTNSNRDEGIPKSNGSTTIIERQSTYFPPTRLGNTMNNVRRYRNDMEDERDDSLAFSDRPGVPHRSVLDRNVIRNVQVYNRGGGAHWSGSGASNSNWYEGRDMNPSWSGQHQQFSAPRPYAPTTAATTSTTSNWSYPRPVVPTHRDRNDWEWRRRIDAHRSMPVVNPSRVVQQQQHHHHHHHHTLIKPTLHEVPAVSNDDSPTIEHQHKQDNKRPFSPATMYPEAKKLKGFDRLDLLVTTTLEMGPLLENVAGCSCPKSKCVALYCDCFKAGQRCDPHSCNCADCKNTVEESGPDGARTKAIRSILTRNPRAFVTAGLAKEPPKLPPGEVACNCIRSRCLKLYCTCFQSGKICNPSVCTCISCLNTKDDNSGDRRHAIQMCLEKRPDAFQTKTKPVGLGCACKNNRCIRKYCECFREKLLCTDSCKCLNCENASMKA